MNAGGPSIDDEIPDQLRGPATGFVNAIELAADVGIPSLDAWRMLTDQRFSALARAVSRLSEEVNPYGLSPDEFAIALEAEAFEAATVQLLALTGDLIERAAASGEES